MPAPQTGQIPKKRIAPEEIGLTNLQIGENIRPLGAINVNAVDVSPAAKPGTLPGDYRQPIKIEVKED